MTFFLCSLDSVFSNLITLSCLPQPACRRGTKYAQIEAKRIAQSLPHKIVIIRLITSKCMPELKPEQPFSTFSGFSTTAWTWWLMLQSCFVVSGKDLVEFTDDERNEDECDNPEVVVDVISWSILVSSDARFTDFSSDKSWDLSGFTERLCFLSRSLLLCKQKKMILVFIKKTTKTFITSHFSVLGDGVSEKTNQ